MGQTDRLRRLWHVADCVNDCLAHVTSDHCTGNLEMDVDFRHGALFVWRVGLLGFEVRPPLGHGRWQAHGLHFDFWHGGFHFKIKNGTIRLVFRVEIAPKKTPSLPLFASLWCQPTQTCWSKSWATRRYYTGWPRPPHWSGDLVYFFCVMFKTVSSCSVSSHLFTFDRNVRRISKHGKWQRRERVRMKKKSNWKSNRMKESDI